MKWPILVFAPCGSSEVDGEMWCYQKPGFKSLLLTELQRQQQCSHFCDTMLRTKDISVPAHSCILSAISPHISSTLSSTPSPPPGQSRILEFQPLGACTLLHVVRLMYCGEMMGEGEKEKQEAISAAARLGIHGLVEVTTENGEHGRSVEVGVQTEPLLEKEQKEGKWVRAVKDGITILWKERLPGGVKDTWTQTEQLQVNTTAPELPFETIDVACLQDLRHTDYSVIPPQIPLIPISLLYPPNETQTPQPSFAPMDSLQESPAAGPFSVVMDPPPSFSSLFSQETASAATPHTSGAASQVAAENEWNDSAFEQFQGNISGYISNFLMPEKQQKKTHRGRPRGRRRDPRARGARTASTGERRPRRPTSSTPGRGRGLYASSASSILHNTPVAPPPQNEQAGHFDHLLEEVMMGLDIFPNISTQPVPPASRSSCTDPTSTSTESRQHGHGGAAGKEGGSSGAPNSKGAVPQQQGETDFREMLENFLSTFEQEIQGCAGTMDVESQTGSLAGGSQAETQTPSRWLEPSAHHATLPKRAGSKKKVPNKPRKKRARKKYTLSSQKRQESVPSSKPHINNLQMRENLQLFQMPVVKLDRRIVLPDRVIKSGETESNSRKCGRDGKSQTAWTGKKMYPIRSKLKEANSEIFLLEQPLQQRVRHRQGCKRTPKNGNVIDISEKVQPAEGICPEKQRKDISDVPGDTSAQPQEDTYEAKREVKRRNAEVEEEIREDASVSKRVRLEEMTCARPPSTPQPGYPNCEPAAREAEEVVDVETLSVSSAEGLQGDRPEWSEIDLGGTEEPQELENSSCDEVIDVDGEDEDDDVLRGSGLVTCQTSITWKEPLNYKKEEEEINIVGVKNLNRPSAVCAPIP
ncbi:uncharacterized protein isoform X3 [Takifugu rubripes]|uniref:uncharacterized protein isoform X3 n=1 Tax=Takifugu rubripes TaxID=31033 RepID=UPI0011456B4D|nr:uncharacterized protein LOC105417348 isoform X3 [Takifugu rubripes]